MYPPTYALGIHADGSHLKVALVSKLKSQISVDLTQMYEADVKLLDILETVLKGKKVISVTGLEPTEMVRRDLQLKLKSKSALLAALPFQAESLIPYPAEDLVLVPYFYPEKEGSTHVLLFATTKNYLTQHLHRAPIDPDQVSSTGVALSRWGSWKFPEKTDLCVMHQGCCVVTSQGKISLLQAYDSQERMRAFVNLKFPDIPIIAEEDPYTIPVGLALDALEKGGLQFRQEEFVSTRSLEKKARWQRLYMGACGVLTLAILSLGFYHLHKREAKLQARLDGIAGVEANSLEKRVEAWERELSVQAKAYPLVPNTPPLKDVLAWISSKKHEINVTHLNYALIKYPRLGESHEPYQVKVILEFTAPTPAIAREFYDSLLKGDPMVNSKQVVTWDAQQNSYKISFFVRT